LAGALTEDLRRRIVAAGLVLPPDQRTTGPERRALAGRIAVARLPDLAAIAEVRLIVRSGA
jgi:hypothetical protein